MECFIEERFELLPRVALVAGLRRAIQRWVWVSVRPGLGYWEGSTASGLGEGWESAQGWGEQAGWLRGGWAGSDC